ncbi:hypothetical protein VB002_15065 [Campylobacter concisus]
MLNELLNASYTSEKNALRLYESLASFGEVFDQIASVRKNAIILIENLQVRMSMSLFAKMKLSFCQQKIKKMR